MRDVLSAVRVVVDEYQLVGTIQRLEQRYPIERFCFAGGKGNHALAVTLRQLVIHRRVRWYPDCGKLPGPHRDDLELELSSLLLKQTSSGSVRIDHHNDGRHHDDRSFALGVACLSLTEDQQGPGELIVTPPREFGSFDW